MRGDRRLKIATGIAGCLICGELMFVVWQAHQLSLDTASLAVDMSATAQQVHRMVHDVSNTYDRLDNVIDQINDDIKSQKGGQ